MTDSTPWEEYKKDTSERIDDMVVDFMNQHRTDKYKDYESLEDDVLDFRWDYQ